VTSKNKVDHKFERLEIALGNDFSPCRGLEQFDIMVRLNGLREFASHARCGGWSASLREPKTPGKGSLNQLKTGLIERPRPRKPRIRSQAESGTSGLHLSERKIRAK